MLNVRRPIIGIEDTISNPVKISILKELEYYIDIDDNDVGLISHQNIDDLVNDNWNINKDSKDVEMKKTIIEISSTEETDEESSFLTPIENKNSPIFKDNNLVIKPVYLNTKTKINIEIKSKSKSYIASIKDKIKLSILNGSDIKQHRIDYRYNLPEIPSILIGIYYKYKEKYGLEKSYTKYIFSHSSDKVSLISTQGGVSHMLSLGVTESQSEVIGRLIADINNEISYDEDRYVLSFEYEINYMKPTYIDSKYDIAFANQQLPLELIATNQTDIGEIENYDSDMLSFLRRDQWFILKLLQIYKHDYIRLPAIDHHISITRTRDETILFSVLTEITPEDRRSLFNLKELGDISIAPNTIKYLIDNHKYLHLNGQAIFNVYIYDSYNERKDLKILVDENLNVYTDVDLDLDGAHRVLFVLNSNWSILPSDTKFRFKQFLSRYKISLSEIIVSNNNNRFISIIKKMDNYNSTLIEYQLSTSINNYTHDLKTLSEIYTTYVTTNGDTVESINLNMLSNDDWGRFKEYVGIKKENINDTLVALSGNINVSIAIVLGEYASYNKSTLVAVIDTFADDSYTLLDILIRYVAVNGDNIRDILRIYSNVNINQSIMDLLNTNPLESLLITLIGERNKPWLFMDSSFDQFGGSEMLTKTVQTSMVHAHILTNK